MDSSYTKVFVKWNKRNGLGWPPCRSPPPSISPSLHLYLSIHLCIVTQTTGPPGSVAWAKAKIALFLPPFPRRSLGAPSHPYKPSLVCVSLMNSLLTVLWQESRWNPETIYSTQREKMKEGRGQLSWKGEYEMHSQNAPLAGKPKICLTFAHFSSLSLIELKFQTPGRLSGEYSRGRREGQREIHVSDEGLNLSNFSWNGHI